MINGCYKCDSSTSCLECQSEYVLLYDNTCLEKTIIESNENYYKDESTNKYYSCSSLKNCIKCKSKDVCTYCKEGCILNNNACEENKESDDNNNDNGLSTGALVGIIVGCLVFILLLIGLLIFLFRKKLFNKKNNDIIDVNEEHIEKEGPKEKEIPIKTDKELVMIHTIKRSISNKQLKEY